MDRKTVVRPTSSVTPEIVGREDELAALQGFFTSASPTSVLLLEGEPGIGKTVLWQAGVEYARNLGRRVLIARPVEVEAQLAFSAIGDLLEPVLDDALESVPRLQRRALEVALLISEGDSSAPDSRLLGIALRNVWRAIATATPLVVAIDDLQWLDSASASAIAFALRRLGSERISLLLARRETAGEPLPYGLPTERVTRIHVGPLSLGALGHLLNRRLGDPFDRPTLRAFEDVTTGNPFFALELGQALIRSRRQVQPGGLFQLPHSLNQLLLARLADLPVQTRRVLFEVAALSDPTLAIVGDEAAVGPAVEAGVLMLEGDRLRFSHPLLAAAVYSQASSLERRTLHRMLAVRAQSTEERARHLALATPEPDAQVAASLEAAAEDAHRRGALQATIELAEQALRLTPSDEHDARIRRRIAAARYYREQGAPGRARLLLDEALADSRPGRERAGVLAGLADVALADNAGGTVVVRQFEEALEELGDADPYLRAEITLELAAHLWIRAEDCVSYATDALAYAEAVGDPHLVARALALRATIETSAGGDLDEESFRRAVAIEEGSNTVWNMGPSLQFANALMWSDRLDEARTSFQRVLSRAREVGSPTAAHASWMLSFVEFHAGNYDRALVHLEEAKLVALEFGEASGEEFVLLARGLAEAGLGRVEAAREHLERSVALAESSGARSGARLWLGFLLLSLGDAEGAYRELAKGRGLVWDLAVPDEVEALVLLGRADEAEQCTSRYEAQGSRLPWRLASAKRCRGLVAAGRGELETAVAMFEQSVAGFESTPRRLDLGRSLLCLGRTQRRAKQKRAARRSLERALDIFERIGARLWAEQTKAEMARLGGRVATASLTATEQRIAALVGTGRPNKEVAAALFITTNSVEKTLTRIYAKLGLRSRAELAHWVSSGDPG